MQRDTIITIDGPSISGKTTIARMLAKRLGFFYLASGLLFRALAYILLHEYKYEDEQFYNPHQKDVDAALERNRFEYRYDTIAGEQVFFDEKNITPFLKDINMSTYASILGISPIVRKALVALQHRIAHHYNVVTEGRDAGSVVFPDATVKFYLTASLAVRAQRFMYDQHAKGKLITFENACQEIETRDHRDMNRPLAPLCIPDNAIIIDDSNMSKEEVIEIMEQKIKMF